MRYISLEKRCKIPQALNIIFCGFLQINTQEKYTQNTYNKYSNIRIEKLPSKQKLTIVF